MGLITFTDQGLYCAAGNFYIDPWKPVDHAIITHAHSDHARWGSKHYLSHTDSYHLLKARLGEDILLETLPYNQPLKMGDVTISFYPAGHIIGSAQVRIEHKGEVWVVSGDYKTEDDGISTAFEPVKCHTFITESTFGLPIYQWKEQDVIMKEIHDWILANQAAGRSSILSAYSLGKAQRLVKGLMKYELPFYMHGAVYNMHETVRKFMELPEATYLNNTVSKEDARQGIIIVPPSAIGTPWMKRWAPYSLGVCSGWMQVRGAQRRRNADAGFILSDHADWLGLLSAIDATEADTVYATHGFSDTLARFLMEERGLNASVVKTRFGEEDAASSEESTLQNED